MGEFTLLMGITHLLGGARWKSSASLGGQELWLQPTQSQADSFAKRLTYVTKHQQSLDGIPKRFTRGTCLGRWDIHHWSFEAPGPQDFFRKHRRSFGVLMGSEEPGGYATPDNQVNRPKLATAKIPFGED